MPSNVLVVGNESKSLKNLPQHLSPYSADFTIFTAADGNEALKILRTDTIDLLITDLQSPEIDCFQLLLQLTTKHPLVPVLIVHASTDDSCNEDAAPSTLEKNLDPKELRDSIMEISTDPKKAGAIFGVCLSNFLQLIEKKNGSCTLAVLTPSKAEGFILFKDGILAQAFLHNTRGKEAARAMLAHKKVSIMIRKLPERNIPNEIECSVRSLLKEDAQQNNKSVNSEKNDNTLDFAEQLDETNGPEEETVLNNVLQELTTITGVTAVGFMKYNGETLAIKSNEDTSKAETIVTTFNDIFGQAHEACKKIDMKTVDEFVIDTPKGTVIMLCSGSDTTEHIHLIAVQDLDGKKAFLKMKAAKLLAVAESYR